MIDSDFTSTAAIRRFTDLEKTMNSNTNRFAHPLLALLFVCLVGCGTSVEGPEPGLVEVPEPDFSTRSQAVEAPTTEVYVTVERAAELLEAGAIALDTRDEELYLEGHLPGAVHAPWSVFGHAEVEGAYVETDPDRAEATANSLGLRNDTPIVVYGDAISTSSARQAWQLEFYGHSNVHILDGGFDAWSATEEVSTDEVRPAAGDFTIAWRPDIIVTGADIQRAIDNDEVVIFFDARSFPEYEGTDDRDNPRHGHIPGAIHYEWTNVYTESGQLRDKEELRAELDAAGLLESDSLVIPYCQGGFRSAVAYSILRWLGQDDVSNYDGSWYEYARANDLPVETP